MKLSTCLPLDKCFHVIAGVGIFALASLAIDRWALLVVALSAIGKEAYDYLHIDRHTPDLADAFYTLAGGLLGLLCTF